MKAIAPILGVCRAPHHPQSFGTIPLAKREEKLRLRGTDDTCDAAQGSRLWNQPSHPSTHQQEGLSCDLGAAERPDPLSACSPHRVPAPPRCPSCHVKPGYSHSLSSERRHSRGLKQEICGEGAVVQRPVPTSLQGLSLHRRPSLTLE